MLISNIHDLNLHDSTLLAVVIAGDEVILELDYIEDYESMHSSKRKLRLHTCKMISLHMNLAYASPDSILLGKELMSEGLRKVRIEMNTTASIIEVIVTKVELE